MGYLIVFAIVIYILYVIIKYISSYPERKRRENENAIIRGVLHGFDINTERAKIINLLKETLPEGYQCGKRGCSGVLLKQSSKTSGSYYVCSKCHNIRLTIKSLRLRK